MKTQTDKSQEPKNSITPRVTSESSNGGTAQLMDNRTSSIDQRKLKSGINSAENSITPIQQKNNTGLPDKFKSSIENLSGYSMDDVKVHYNSSKPAQLQAHAYAQGTDIHLAPGQEKHLPHEAWHVVQQKQGRVKPTRQLKSKVNINDDAGLEKEADVMGAKVLRMQSANSQNLILEKENGSSNTIQRRREDTYILRLLFSGSGHNFISENRRIEVENNVHQDEKWSTEERVKVKKRLLPTTHDTEREKVEEFDIAGPGAPKANWFKSLAGTVDVGSNKIANLKTGILELVKRKIIENKDLPNKKIKIVGHSRGAVAGAYVAEALKQEYRNQRNQVEVSYSGYDPVPDAKYFIDLGSTTPTDLESVDKSAVVYSVASGQTGAIDSVRKKMFGKKTQHKFSGLMKPKALLNSKVVILTSAQHSANLNGVFEYVGKEYSMFNLVDLPGGVYVEDEWIEMEGGGKRGEDSAFGKIILAKLNDINDFDNAYKELQKESKAIPDWGRQKEVKKAAVTTFTNENDT
ncbi:DUF4157 domain-containing protein [Aquimarina gracilis]|uniref:DUF4157 domain-containing protein n=1 Tax=Aquimarina gracilis TaxID=874422 RepID=A0ABU5ZQ39_9FLAO|nr:DUF4157 domain-containing protein [Aquimarina gracilis]MEB3344044.1 DUF4157 domain-containing protein [Aquimarina gracilis]